MINSNLIRRNGLKTLNAWKVKIGGDKFIITPAHNVIYRPNNSDEFIPSPFVPTKYKTDWYVCKKYTDSTQYNLKYDLAWKPISKYSSAIDSEYLDINQIYHTNYFYYQPYNWKQEKTKSSYSLGCANTIIYSSPETEYFEAIGIGWRGLSGAIITNIYSTKFLGLFIRRIGNLGISQSDSTIQTEMTGVSRGFIIPTKQIEKIIHLEPSLKIL